MQRYSILWVDDEIDLLKPHILFLETRGYQIDGINNGSDALDLVKENNYDIVFLDENMPGLNGLDTLSQLKVISPNLPVIMITKSEEEYIMEEAIGAKIADYLIKPLNPNQILLSVKKILDNERIVSQKTNQNYQQEFMTISELVSDAEDFEDWNDIYKKLVYWDLEIDKTEEKSMAEILDNQRSEANNHFSEFIERSYEDWLNDPNVAKPLLSHQVFEERVKPKLENGLPTFFIVVDNLRYDQWKIIEPEISKYFNIDTESTYYSILPTTTAYARNAIFSGLMPQEMKDQHPDLWVGEDVDENKNSFEHEFLQKHLERLGISCSTSYNKIFNSYQGKKLVDNIGSLMQTDLNAIVYNFVDMLSHARTDMQMIKELAADESAYRSITLSWFQHSSMFDLLKALSNKKANICLTTDHGTIRVKKPVKIVGDKNTSTNLRYKQGRTLSHKANVYDVRKPERLFLPKVNLTTSYVFTKGDDFFVYPNNQNHYVNHYRDTFQHGGISMEEMILPFIHLQPKNG